MKTMSEIIGERLKSLREKKNLSQAQLSKLCGWSTASRVGNYELGVRNVGIDDAVILAKVLGTTPSELLFGDQGDPSNWLTDKQKKVIDLFNQLPEAEQERMIDIRHISCLIYLHRSNESSRQDAHEVAATGA